MIDTKIWLDYLKLLDSLAKTIGQLTELEQQKTLAVSQGRLDTVEDCMKREQALSLSLRGCDQKREAMLAKMGLQNIPLRQLEQYAPEGLEMETKRVANELRGKYSVFQSASQVARNTLECNLRAIERIQEKQQEGAAAPPAERASQYDLRAYARDGRICFV